jgi:hypothetical protein
MYLDAQQWDRAYAAFGAAAKIYSDIANVKLDEQLAFAKRKWVSPSLP